MSKTSKFFNIEAENVNTNIIQHNLFCLNRELK